MQFQVNIFPLQKKPPILRRQDRSQEKDRQPKKLKPDAVPSENLPSSKKPPILQRQDWSREKDRQAVINEILKEQESKEIPEDFLIESNLGNTQSKLEDKSSQTVSDE